VTVTCEGDQFACMHLSLGAVYFNGNVGAYYNTQWQVVCANDFACYDLYVDGTAKSPTFDIDCVTKRSCFGANLDFDGTVSHLTISPEGCESCPSCAPGMGCEGCAVDGFDCPLFYGHSADSFAAHSALSPTVGGVRGEWLLATVVLLAAILCINTLCLAKQWSTDNASKA